MGFYGSNDPTNSVKALKEDVQGLGFNLTRSTPTDHSYLLPGPCDTDDTFSGSRVQRSRSQTYSANALFRWRHSGIQFAVIDHLVCILLHVLNSFVSLVYATSFLTLEGAEGVEH